MASTHNKDKLAKTIREQVVAVFRELLSDPDAGLVLQPSTEARLRKSIKSVQAGRTKSFAEIFKR